jgi:hypothetical protein
MSGGFAREAVESAAPRASVIRSDASALLAASGGVIPSRRSRLAWASFIAPPPRVGGGDHDAAHRRLIEPFRQESGIEHDGDLAGAQPVQHRAAPLWCGVAVESFGGDPGVAEDAGDR